MFVAIDVTAVEYNIFNAPTERNKKKCAIQEKWINECNAKWKDTNKKRMPKQNAQKINPPATNAHFLYTAHCCPFIPGFIYLYGKSLNC